MAAEKMDMSLDDIIAGKLYFFFIYTQNEFD
jgi:hypothetical protein